MLVDPGFVLSATFRTQRDQIHERSHRFIDEKYRLHKDRFFDSLSDWLGEIADDQLMDRFRSDWGRLCRTLLFDADEKLEFKPQVSDVTLNSFKQY